MLQAYIRSAGLFLLFTVFWVRLLYIAAFVVFTVAEAPLIDLHQDGSSPVYAVLHQTGSDTTYSPYTTSQMQHPPTATPYPHASPELPVPLPYLQSPSSSAVSQPTTHLHCQPPPSCSQPSIFTQPTPMFHSAVPSPPFGYPQSHQLLPRYRIHHHHKCNIHRLPIIQTMFCRRLLLYLLNTHLLHHISLHFTLMCHTLTLLNLHPP